MSQEKYIGLDVHQASISAAVMDPSGNVLMECLLETKAATILTLAWVSCLQMTMFELLTQTALADSDLLRKNDAMGDTFTITREVDFAFETKDKQRADGFAEFVNGKSYGNAAVRQIRDDNFQVLVLITMPIMQHLIGCVSGFMLCE
jgi:hypothetical protein